MSLIGARPGTALSAFDENAARYAAKPAAADPMAGAARGGLRRAALGDISNTHVGAAGGKAVGAKPVVSLRPSSALTMPASMATAASLMLPAPASTEAPMDTGADLSSLSIADAAIMDVDAADSRDPNYVSEYVNQIYAFFKDTEVAKTARFGYMAHQADINEKMRAILIDWLIEVHLKFKLMPETMYLTVNIIDRYLEKTKNVIRQKLQLVGVTAMLLASKYEEIYAPEVRDFVYITDKAYTREQILHMESSMLNTLDFRITVPTGYVFLNRYLKVAEADQRTTLLATYFLERSLQEYRMLHHCPSKTAAACVNMALRTLRGRDAWTPTLAHYSGYSEMELRGAILEMQDIMTGGTTSSLQAVRKKYTGPKFGEVATIPLASLDA